MKTKHYKTDPRCDFDNLWLPFTQMAEPITHTPKIIGAKGCWLVDDKGKEYLDGIASWWVNIHGHDHPRLIAAITRQASVLAHCSMGSMVHEPGLELAKRLADIAPPGLTRVFFSDDGSTAVEAALKISFQYFQQNGQPHRRRFIALEGAYHGDTLGGMSLGDIGSYHQRFRDLCFPVLRAPAPDCFRCDEGPGATRSISAAHESGGTCTLKCLSSLESIFKEHGDETCALVVEPLVQGAGGMRMYRADALKRMRELCDQHGAHLILDCVAVAFGRTGKMFASEHAGISPDLMAVAKGLTGGLLPMAATLATEEIFMGFLGGYDQDRKLAHGHSFTGNPLAAACAVENLKIFEEEAVLGQVTEKSNLLEGLWKTLIDLPHVVRPRTIGMIAALDLERDPEKGIRYKDSDRIGKKVAASCLEMGLFVRPLGDTMYLLPPLAISEKEIEFAVSTMKKAISSVTGS